MISVADEADVQSQVVRAAAAGLRVRTSGTGHSFTPIVETDVLLDTTALRGISKVDVGRLLVSAGPKTTIRDFGEPLW
ncbi:MAG TPA: FAD-binding protein, partial [Acidimicrobiia bacterium]